ncbi:Hypothetical protein MVR_LOCUS115 [uncultured virus]|nr:Hypothetical protein MVR_LOCUS115 [uncultured virus]
MDPVLIAERAARYNRVKQQRDEEQRVIDQAREAEHTRHLAELSSLESKQADLKAALVHISALTDCIRDANSMYGVFFVLKDIYTQFKTHLPLVLELSTIEANTPTDTPTLLQAKLAASKRPCDLGAVEQMGALISELIGIISQNENTTFNINTGENTEVWPKIIAKVRKMLVALDWDLSSLDIVTMDTTGDEELAARIQGELFMDDEEVAMSLQDAPPPDIGPTRSTRTRPQARRHVIDAHDRPYYDARGGLDFDE